MDEVPKLLKVHEGCERTGLGRTKFSQLLGAEIPVIRIGRAVRISSRDLDAWMRRQEDQARSERERKALAL